MMALQSWRPQLRDAALRLIERNIAVLPFISNQEIQGKADWVGIDNVAAGATAAALLGKFSHVNNGAILLISESMQSRDSLERRYGFDQVINADYPHLHSLPSLETYGVEGRARDIIKTSLAANSDVSGVYIMSSEARLPLEVLQEAWKGKRPVVIAHERTSFTEQALIEDSIDAVIAQDPGHLVRSAIRKLRANLQNRELIASQEKIRLEVILKQNL
jgi:LacI family transcriptional regulator